MDYYSKVPDLLEAGIIVIDAGGYIKVYNEVAQSFFGLNPLSGPGHPGGSLKDGDIVVIADNVLGDDDGFMKPEDLRIIGVDPKGIDIGSAVLAVGRKGDKALNGLCKFLPKGHQHNTLSLETKLEGVLLQVQIDFIEKVMNIKVDGIEYSYRYFLSVGHMVALDGLTHQVKFYQHRGFTSRKEGLKPILNGNLYEGKGEYANTMDLSDKHILQLHPDSEVVNKLLNTAYGEEEGTCRMESFINMIPVRCSIRPLDHEGERIGALLEIFDITELKAIQIERERAITNLKRLEERITLEKLQKQSFQSVIGQSSQMKKVIQTAIKMAETDSTILLLGESGTGKNLFAEAIHKASPRRNGPFVYINCASIPENLLESELFGHKKGSFTGAVSDKRGQFELADKGTIFLDEISEFPLALQAKLLHVLQSRAFTMVGGLEQKTVDIRIITASNRDLTQLVSKGIFRNDLFYRINVLSLNIPPLRERKEDLLQLIEYLSERLSKKAGTGKKVISPEVVSIFFNYDWPGNIRELENLLERAMVMSNGVIYPEHLPQYILESNYRDKGEDNSVYLKNIGPYKDILEQVEKQLISKALEICGGNRKKAIDILQMGKTGFYEKLKKFELQHK